MERNNISKLLHLGAEKHLPSLPSPSDVTSLNFFWTVLTGSGGTVYEHAENE